jgi:hypothetical protein
MIDVSSRLGPVAARTMKLLVLTAEPVSADVVREAVGDEASDAEVMVVSPALTGSPLRFWMSDADEAIEHARETAEETADRLDEAGIDAAGDTGESDPLLALEDALQTFAADRVVVFTHPRASAITSRTTSSRRPSAASASPWRTARSCAADCVQLGRLLGPARVNGCIERGWDQPPGTDVGSIRSDIATQCSPRPRERARPAL